MTASVPSLETVVPLDESYTGIVFCPCCCTTVDVQGAGTQLLVCGSCEQEWVQTVDPERQASHSIN